jgi:hypothetical protein
VVNGTAIPMQLCQGSEYHADLRKVLPFDSKSRVNVTINAETEKGKKAAIETTVLLRVNPSKIIVDHTPVTACKSGTDVTINAVVDSALPIRKAILHYSYVNQFEKMEDIEFAHNGNEYSAVIPGSYIVPHWDLLYYFEFVDELGSGIIYPDFREQTPYWVINTREGK